MSKSGHVEVNIFVQGLNPKTSGENIQNYFEAISKVKVKDDSVVFGIDHTEALVTFRHRPDLPKLKWTVRERKLDGFTLDICEVPAPRAIVVSSDVQVRSKEALMLYFEREQIGGGPLKKDRLEETEDGCFILEFEDPKVVQQVCSHRAKPHQVDGVLLRVSPYYQCDNGVIWDTSLHLVPVPKPVNIQILPDQLEFVRNFGKTEFAAMLRDKNADVSFSKDHVTVTCVLKPSMKNYRSLVRTWETSVQEVVVKFLHERIEEAEIDIPDNIWDKMLEWISLGNHEFGDILTKPDRNRKRIKLIGFTGALKGPRYQINQRIDALTTSARRRSETHKVGSIEKLMILEIQGTFSEIRHQFKDMTIHVDGNQVRIDGDFDDIHSAFSQIYKECDDIEPVVFKHNKCREFVQFVKDESTRRYIQQKMSQKRVKGSWTINGTEINTFAPKGGNFEAIKNVILESVLEKSIEVEGTVDLQSEMWTEFLRDKQEQHKDKAMIYTKHPQTVMVIGTNDIAGGVIEQIEDFLDETTVKRVRVPCDLVILKFIQEHWTNEDDFDEIQKCGVVFDCTNGLELTGSSGNLILGKEKLMMKLKRMCSKKHKFSQTGVYGVIEHAKHVGTLKSIEKNCRCLIKLPWELESSTLVLEDADDVRQEAQMEGEHAASHHGPRFLQTRNHKIAVHLVQGDIGAQKADIIVCSTSPGLNLRSGPATQSLLNSGGASLQSECEQSYPDRIKDGTVVVIGGGNLKCDKVYLTSLPTWKEACSNGGKVLKNFMRECLRLADKHSKRSLAINAMGTGAYLGYPKDVAANIMYSAVVEFDKSYTKTSVKEISFVLYGKDTDTIRAFKDQERSWVFGKFVKNSLSDDFVNGRIKIELVTDDLAKQKVDALLCSTSPDMDLSRSKLCESLLQHGGKSIQDECWKRHGKELGVGKVVDVQAGKLPSKTIFLTVLPKYSETGERSLKSILEEVFRWASKQGYQSLAIPALGTGYLNYPKPIAAKCMYSAVIECVNRNPKTSLRLIKFVMHSKDTEAQMAWRHCHLHTKGAEERAYRNFRGDATIRHGGDGKYKMVTDGCVIGPIKLNVVVGDILDNDANAIVNGVGNNFDLTGAVAKALINRCPNIQAECQQKIANLKRWGVVMTGASGLKTTYVIHVLFQDTLTNWRTKMVACLEEANKKLIKSVAFPVIGAGSGQKSFTPDSIAECLFMAIDDFAGKVAQPSVTDVRLVIHSSNAGDQQAIMSALQGKTIAAINQTPVGKWFRAGIGKLADICGLNASKGLQMAAPSRQKLKTEMSTVQVVMHSDAMSKIEDCIRELEDHIRMQYNTQTITVDQSVLKSLTHEEVDELVNPDFLVDVKFDKRAGKLHVSGPLENVLPAVNFINTKLGQYGRANANRDSAETLYKQVRWHFEDITPTAIVDKPYGKMPNYVIETAYRKGEKSVELTDTKGKTYVVDFKEWEEYTRDNRADTVKVIRKDFLKGASSVPLPTSWVSMDKNENVRKVTLNTSDPEYQKIEKMFISQVKSGPYAIKNANRQDVKVTRIERIQNRTLYQQYAAKKALMEQQQKSSGKQIERQAWHGTKEDVITSIISNGFNRSYCGTNAGVHYGQGVYFAADASYSAQSYLTGSTPGMLNRRYMFVVKVLGANFIKGHPDMRFLPPINPARPLVLYDCAVNNTQNPMEFVVFHDTQAYPEYLITYNG